MKKSSTEMSRVKFTTSSIYFKLVKDSITTLNDLRYEETLKDGSKVSWVLTKGTIITSKSLIVGLMLGQVNAWLFKSFMKKHYSEYLTARRLKLIYTRIAYTTKMNRLAKIFYVYF